MKKASKSVIFKEDNEIKQVCMSFAAGMNDGGVLVTMNKLRFVGAVLLLALCVSLVAGAAPMTTNETTMPRAGSTGAHGSNEIIEGKSPLTGLSWSGTYRPILVQINNAIEARPHWNLSEADIVYESLLWGPGHTRYTAVYNSNYPEIVGSVRSARVHHCELREEWDAPLVFYGGQQDQGTNIYEFMKAQSVPKELQIDGTRGGSKALSRDSSRVSPHNAVVNLAMLSSELWPTQEDGSPYQPRQHAMKFASTPTRGIDTAKEIHLVYGEQEGDKAKGYVNNKYYPHYTFNPAERVYERWYNGEEMVDGKSGKRIVASNVIVQYTEMEYVMKIPSRPKINTIGGGVMDAFIDGQHIRGTWERNTFSDRTVFMDASGEELTLLPGQTYIQIIPTDMSYWYVQDDGTEVEVNYGSEVRAIEIDTSISDEDINKMDEGEVE